MLLFIDVVIYIRLFQICFLIAMSDLAQKWVTVVQNGTNPGLLKIKSSVYFGWNLMLESPGIVPFICQSDQLCSQICHSCFLIPHLFIYTWPSGKLPFECQKIAKNLTFFFFKLPKNFIFFQKKLPMAIFLKKMSSFWQFFDIQMAIFLRVWFRNKKFVW